MFPHLTPGEAIITAVQPLSADTPGVTITVDQVQKPAGLGREFIKASAQHFMSKAVGDGDVIGRDLDVLDLLAVMLDGLHRPLVLVQEGDRP